MNTSVIQREQYSSILPNTNLIPAGSILLIHTPMIIPSGNAVEVLYAPQAQISTLAQSYDPLENISGSLQQSKKCFHEVRPQGYFASSNDLEQQRHQQQQKIVYRCENQPCLLQTEKSATPKSDNAHVNLLQQFLVNNCALGENLVNMPALEKFVSRNSPVLS